MISGHLSIVECLQFFSAFKWSRLIKIKMVAVNTYINIVDRQLATKQDMRGKLTVLNDLINDRYRDCELLNSLSNQAK